MKDEKQKEPPRAVFDPITVERQRRGVSPGVFRAHTPVPPAWGHLPGVLGSETEAGPWVEACGDSHANAMDNLMRVIGRLCVLHFGGTAL